VNGSSRGIILVCEECGEKTILDAPLSVRCSGSTLSRCECGKRLTPANRHERAEFGEEDVGSATNAEAQTSSLRYRRSRSIGEIQKA
jgi:hypothetical protein